MDGRQANAEEEGPDLAARNAARLLREDPEHPRVTAARERVRARRAERDQRDR